jgi:hypothetical protein
MPPLVTTPSKSSKKWLHKESIWAAPSGQAATSDSDASKGAGLAGDGADGATERPCALPQSDVV